MADQIVEIRTFPSEWEATLARDFLEAAGIPAYIDTAGRDFLPPIIISQDVHRVRLVVHQRDVERAEEALQAFETD